MLLFSQTLMRWLAMPLAVVMFVTTSGIGVAQAGIVATDEVAQDQRLEQERERLLTMLEREDVRRELIDMGVSPDEASQRIAALSDQELQQVLDRVDEMPAGQDVLGAILVVGLVVLVVLIITDITGATDVFTFTK